jgi:hypothetical protein
MAQGTPGPNRRASGLRTNAIAGLDCESTLMSSAEDATRVQPAERLGLSPMESEMCPLFQAAFYKRKNDHTERHQLSQARSRSFWDGRNLVGCAHSISWPAFTSKNRDSVHRNQNNLATQSGASHANRISRSIRVKDLAHQFGSA